MKRMTMLVPLLGWGLFCALSCSGEDEQSPIAASGGTGGAGGTATPDAGGADASGGGGATDAQPDGPDPCADHCHNDAQDCGEEGVDCGGTCSSCGVVTISPPGACGFNPDVAAAGPDRVMAVWEQSSPAGVHYACFDGAAWTNPQPVAETGVTQNTPRIAVDSQGRFHVVYSEGLGGSRQAHYTRFDGACPTGSFTPPEVASDGDTSDRSSAFPAVAVDEQDLPWVTWSQSLVPQEGGTCQTQGDCPVEYTCVINWGVCKPRRYAQHATRKQPTGWDAIAELSAGNDGFAHYGRLSIVDAADVHLVWLHAADAGSRRIYHAKFNGTQWSAPEQTGLGAHTADVAADATRIHVFNYHASYATRLQSEQSWTETNVDQGDFSFIGLGLDPAGLLHAAWMKECTIRYSEGEAATGDWLSATAISAPDTSNIHLGLAVAEAGYAYVVWTTSQDAACPASEECGAISFRKVRYEDLP